MSVDWMSELCWLGLAALVCCLGAFVGCAAVDLFYRLRDRRKSPTDKRP